MPDQLHIVPVLMFVGSVIAVFGPMVVLILLIARTPTLQAPERQPPREPQPPWRMAPLETTSTRTSIDTGDLAATEGSSDQPDQRHGRYAPFGDRSG